jgi:hypothetical protein
MFYFPNTVVLFTGDYWTSVAMNLELIMESYSGTTKLIIRCAAYACISRMESGGTFLHMSLSIQRLNKSVFCALTTEYRVERQF